MNNSLDDVLQRYFDDVARHDRLGDTPVRVVMRRGRRRRARRRTGAMAGTLMVGALGSVVAVRTLSGGDDARRSVSVGNDASEDGRDGTPSPVPTAEGQQPELVASPLVWNEVTVGSAEAIIQPWFDGPTGLAEGTYYAVATEPGRSPEPRPALYRSSDGLHWERTGAPPEQLANRSTLAVGSDRLYAVGTVAATAPVEASKDPGVAVIASSADGGTSWDEHDLPFDLSAIRALPDVAAVAMGQSVASRGSHVVVAGVSYASLDTATIAPAGVDPRTLTLQPGFDGAIEFTTQPCDGSAPATVPPPTVDDATTTVVVPPAGDSGCVAMVGDPVRTYSWAELGVTDETAAAHRGQLHLASSSDGASFAAVAPPALPDGWLIGQVRLASTPTGFVMTVGMTRTIEPSTGAREGQYEQQSLAFTSGDGTTWTPLDLPLTWVESVGTVADGTLVVSGSDGQGPLVAARRGDGWSTTRLNQLVAPGGVAPEHYMSRSTVIGAAGIAALVDVFEPVAEQADGPPTGDAVETTVVIDPSTQRTLLLFSRDGVSWSAEPLDELIGTSWYVNGIRQAGAQVIIDLGDPAASSAANAPLPDRTVLVGTLAG